MFEYLVTDSEGHTLTLITSRNPFDVFDDIVDVVTVGEFSPATDSVRLAWVA